MRAEKAALWALTVSAVYPGLWALVWPRSFHASFPGAGLHWVSSLGPFDEHLVRAGSRHLALLEHQVLHPAQHRHLHRRHRAPRSVRAEVP